MKPTDATAEGKALVLDHPEFGSFLTFHAWPAPGAIVWADMAWNQPGRHGLHRIDGHLTGEGPWRIGEWTVRLFDVDNPEPLDAEWLNYQVVMKRRYGSLAQADAQARRAAVDQGLLPE